MVTVCSLTSTEQPEPSGSLERAYMATDDPLGGWGSFYVVCGERLAGGWVCDCLAARGQPLDAFLDRDDAMPDFAGNFTKMNIDGEEPAALRGRRFL
jgi:hypothetical protein